MEMTFKLKDGMYVAEVDEATASELGVLSERRFILVKTDLGFVLEDVETAEDMAIIEDIMDEDDEVLRKLAQ